MRPYHTIAIPDRDILEGRFEYSIFAADLWEVVRGRAPVEYRHRDEFFRKTFLTQGLETLLRGVERRLTGKGGDPVIQLQTPFGGGKTHSLIALYHRGTEWQEKFGVKLAVFSGTALEGEDRLWELLEEQLTGRVEKLRGAVAPGRDRLLEVLEAHQPVLILIDELLLYLAKGAGVKVGESTMAGQTLVFLQELTEVMGLLERGVLVLAYPSQPDEELGEIGERLLDKLKKVSGRVENIYTPVEEWEISQVIRKRLFSEVGDKEMEEVVDEVVKKFQQENILPDREHPSEYRERFRKSYPFLPEVIEVLYQRWGSFPKFQRTRGVLRLLAMVIGDTKDKPLPYISLADFNLANPQIREELLKPIGTEYNSVIGADITGPDAGAKKADLAVGASYRGLQLGTRAATTIFLYSFSGGEKRGATREDVKRVATTLSNPASVVGEVLEELKRTLFYLQQRGGLYFFTNQPNLNRIKLVKLANLEPELVRQREWELLTRWLRGRKRGKPQLEYKIYQWVEESKSIADGPEFKLVILPEERQQFFREVVTRKGDAPRVYQNNIFFLTPGEGERRGLEKQIKELLVVEEILEDETLNLREEQRRELEREVKKLSEEAWLAVRKGYNQIFVPEGEEFCRVELEPPALGMTKPLPEEVFEKLIDEGELLDQISPEGLQDYLERVESGEVEIGAIYENGLRVRDPDGLRFIGVEPLVKGVREGVRRGLFGVAPEEGGVPIFGPDGGAGLEELGFERLEEGLREVDGSWWIVRKEECRRRLEQLERARWEKAQSAEGRLEPGVAGEGAEGPQGVGEVGEGHLGGELGRGGKVGSGGGDEVGGEVGGPLGEGGVGLVEPAGSGEGIERGTERDLDRDLEYRQLLEGGAELAGEPQPGEGKSVRDEVELKVKVPQWMAFELTWVISLLSERFKDVEVEIKARNGQISEEEYRQIKEKISQLDLHLP